MSRIATDPPEVFIATKKATKSPSKMESKGVDTATGGSMKWKAPAKITLMHKEPIATV